MNERRDGSGSGRLAFVSEKLSVMSIGEGCDDVIKQKRPVLCRHQNISSVWPNVGPDSQFTYIQKWRWEFVHQRIGGTYKRGKLDMLSYFRRLI